jgi:hypothetical protein
MSLGISDVCLPPSQMQSVTFPVAPNNYLEVQKFKEHTQNWIGMEVQQPCMDVNNKKLRVEVLGNLSEQLQQLVNFIEEAPSILEAIQSSCQHVLSGRLVDIKPIIATRAHEAMGSAHLIKQINTVKGYVLQLTQFQHGLPQLETLQFQIRNLEIIIPILKKNSKHARERECQSDKEFGELKAKADLPIEEQMTQANMLANLSLLNSTWSSIYATSENLFSAALACAKGTLPPEKSSSDSAEKQKKLI